MSIRVLVADDQPLMRAAYEMTLRAEPDMELVGEAVDGMQAVEQARSLHPDVVLMDVRMPVLDGVAATRVLAAELPRTAILVLTTFDVDDYAIEALRAGAAGFLLKDVQLDELAEAIRIVARGDAMLSPAVTRHLLDALHARALDAKPKRARALEVLTESELRVLELVGRGLTNEEIATELFVAPTTVRTHLHHITDKLGLRSRVEAVVLAFDTGLVHPNPR